MGYLGFVFQIEHDELKLLHPQNFAVFVELKSFPKNVSIGLSRFFPQTAREYLITSEYSIVPWKSSIDGFLYGKIALSKITELDFTNHTFWLSSKLYREVRSLLTIQSLRYSIEQELMVRTTELVELFLSKDKRKSF